MESSAFDDRERIVVAVVAITVLALVARFVLLGDRVAHWDEARVGHWILNYMQTGNYAYRPVIHGPFYHHINPILFGWFGITDATMRIAPALVTGLLPLTVLLLRDRLRRLETIVLALFLAVDPIVLYYSRFMRGDPLVGAFMFAGFVFLVGYIDTGRDRHVLGAALVIALGFTAKENALLYVLSWVGALVLLLDQRLLIARYRDQQWVAVLLNTIKRPVSSITHSDQVLISYVIVLPIFFIFFYTFPEREENTLLHGLSLISVIVLLLNVRLRIRYRNQEWETVFSSIVKPSTRGVTQPGPVLTTIVLEFFVIIVFFYASGRSETNALLYGLSAIGMLVLLLDLWLLVRYRDRNWRASLSNTIKDSTSGITRNAVVLIVGIIEFFVIIVFFYAPRQNGKFYVAGPNGGTEATLSQLFVNPSLLFGVIQEATIGSFRELYDYWVLSAPGEHSYLPYFLDLLETLGYGSAALCLFALIGFLANRYSADRPRKIVTFAFIWGVSSLFGYPLVTDIKAPWAAVHVVLPFMIPAAVGVRIVIREGYAALMAGLRTTDERIAARNFAGAGIVAVILLLASAQIAVIGVSGVYQEPSSDNNKIVQYAQPADDVHPTLHAIERIAARNEGTDVVIYGSRLVRGNPNDKWKPSCTRSSGWFNTLPLPWYLVRSDAAVTCVANETALGSLNGNPPVIIAHADYVVEERNGKNVTVPMVPRELETRFEGYNVTNATMRTIDTEMVFLIDSDWMAQNKESSRTNQRPNSSRIESAWPRATEGTT